MELIVVDGGSSDRTLDIVREFASSVPIRLITPARRGNWAAVSNIGLREARGEWACFLHQDDVWLPGRRPEINGFGGTPVVHSAEYLNADGEILGSWTCPFESGLITATISWSDFWCRISWPYLPRIPAIRSCRVWRTRRIPLVRRRLGLLASIWSDGAGSLHFQAVDRIWYPFRFSDRSPAAARQRMATAVDVFSTATFQHGRQRGKCFSSA